MFRRFVAAVLALTLPFAAFAQTGAVVESLRGVAQAGNAELKQGQRLTGPTTLSTQAGAQASCASTTACRSCSGRTLFCASSTSATLREVTGRVRAPAWLGAGCDRSRRGQ